MHDARRRAAATAGVAALAIAATALTPIGIELWTHTLDAARRMRESGVLEFQPPRLDALELLPFWAIAAALVGLAAASRPWRRGSAARDGLVLAALAMVPVALAGSRNVPLVLLVAVPAVSRLQTARWPSP